MPAFYDVYVTIEGQDCLITASANREKADEAFNLALHGLVRGQTLTMVRIVETKKNQTIEVIQSVCAGM